MVGEARSAAGRPWILGLVSNPSCLVGGKAIFGMGGSQASKIRNRSLATDHPPFK